MEVSYKNLKETVQDIYSISLILYEFSKNNIDMEETACLHTGIKILHQKINELNFEILKTDSE